MLLFKLVLIKISIYNIFNLSNGEYIKALVGDTIHLECPKQDATWFYRSIDRQNEDLVVTRHGIIAAPYKKKLSCLNTNRKTLVINKIQIEDEGMYTCLYSLPTTNEWDLDPVSIQQQRYKFNISVYTLIDGLSIMFIKSSSKQQEIRHEQEGESVLTIRENDEVQVTCVVERSRPAAHIHFSLGPDKSMSILSMNTNIFKNEDKTYKTLLSVRLKAHVQDQGKQMSCVAENLISNQKWEQRRILNIQYTPQCKDTKNNQIFVGVNQTAYIECNIKSANPTQVSFEWHLTPSIAYKNSFVERIQFQNEALSSKFKYTPSSLDDFGELVCKASNEVGTSECLYELKLGGVPNPPYDCTYYLKNSSAIIYCQLGFHQGDPDLYCYLLRKTDNGVYKEHTRSRDSCSFIVNDVSLDKQSEFWIYSSNKFGHNKDSGVHMSIGETQKLVNNENLLMMNGRTLVMLGAASGVILLLLILCCFCFNMRKRYDSQDFDLIREEKSPRQDDFLQTYYDKEPAAGATSSTMIIRNQNYLDKSMSNNSILSSHNKMVTFTTKIQEQELYTTIKNKNRSRSSSTDDNNYVSIKAQNDYDNIVSGKDVSMSSHNLGILV